MFPNSVLEKYVCHTITEVLIKLFERSSAYQLIVESSVDFFTHLFWFDYHY